MDAVILAAGKGTRMLPLTWDIPKPLLLIQGRPLLEWSLLVLRPLADRVTVVVGYLQDQIGAYMRQQTIFADYMLVEQPEPLGTGHAIQCCRPYLSHESFIVINGDDLYGVSGLRQLAATQAGLLGAPRYEASKWGVLVTNGDGSLSRVHEKPPEGLYPLPTLVNTGAYKLNDRIFDFSLTPSSRGEYEITDYVTWLAGQQALRVVRSDFWFPVGTPDDLAQAQNLELPPVRTSEQPTN
jgi:NDP-sugar pyrophosphorylase family protein